MGGPELFPGVGAAVFTAQPFSVLTSRSCPRSAFDTADAIELGELLQSVVGWLAADPATLSSSLLAYVGHPAYSLDGLRCDLDRFAFLLGGNDGEHLLEPGPG